MTGPDDGGTAVTLMPRAPAGAAVPGSGGGRSCSSRWAASRTSAAAASRRTTVNAITAQSMIVPFMIATTSGSMLASCSPPDE